MKAYGWHVQLYVNNLLRLTHQVRYVISRSLSKVAVRLLVSKLGANPSIINTYILSRSCSVPVNCNIAHVFNACTLRGMCKWSHALLQKSSTKPCISKTRLALEDVFFFIARLLKFDTFSFPISGMRPPILFVRFLRHQWPCLPGFLRFCKRVYDFKFYFRKISLTGLDGGNSRYMKLKGKSDRWN